MKKETREQKLIRLLNEFWTAAYMAGCASENPEYSPITWGAANKRVHKALSEALRINYTYGEDNEND